MKLQIELGVSQISDYIEVDLEDLGVSQEEWNELSSGEQHDLVQNYVFELPDQPYWMVENF